MQTELVPMDDLKPLERNPRRHNEKQIGEIVRSLEMFGQYRPLVVDDDNVVLAGNGVFLGLQQAGWTEASVYRMKGLSNEDRNRLVLADNRIAELTNDDFDVIEELLREIGDYEVPGFDPDVVREIVADADEIADRASGYGVLDDQTIDMLKGAQEPLEEANSQARVGSPPEPPAAAPSGPVTDDKGVQVCPTCKREW